MEYKIIVDSCCELPENLKKDERFERIPLGLEVGDYHVLDDENFDQHRFLQEVASTPKCPRSSCPSPERFAKACEGDAQRIYMVTLSSKLSGSYNSAVLGKELFLEEGTHKQIHVIDSKSASCGETQIALKLMELEEKGFSFDEIVERIATFRDELHTYFVLDNLETLRKNGRLSGVRALVASTLSIKPVMGSEDGNIVEKAKTIGMKKALSRMALLAAEEVQNPEEKCLMITHCNAPERAEKVKEMILEKTSFRDVLIMDTAGVSSMYAADGGIIVVV